MAIIRTNKHENRFVQLDKYFINDERLSWKSKGLMAYLLSRPDDWEVRKSDLIKRSTDGRTVIDNALKELMELGYIYYYQERTENGKFGEWVYEVYERPEFNKQANILEAQERIKKQRERERLREERKKEKKTMELLIESPKAGFLNSDESPKAGFPKAGFPKAEKPKAENPPYTNNELTNNELTNIDFNNNYYHHLIEVGFSGKEAALLCAFGRQKDLLDDDDDKFHMLVNKLKGKVFTSIKYIETTYNNMIREMRMKKKKLREEVIPEYLKPGYKDTTIEDMTPEEREKFEREKAEFEERMRNKKREKTI